MKGSKGTILCRTFNLANERDLLLGKRRETVLEPEGQCIIGIREEGILKGIISPAAGS
jgi:hypothetical protein